MTLFDRQTAMRWPLLLLALLMAWPAALPGQQEKDKKEAEKQEASEKSEKPPEKDDGVTSKVRVEVVGGEKDEPVDNASVYVKYMRERTLRKDEKIEMSTKTSRSGLAIVDGVPRGKVLVQVVAPGWKTFGQWYDLEKSEHTIRIKLQKPLRWY